ncbi:hypothetical protein [uncultured Methylobacterium sp.]|uniref:hypothetical protein n=1 Tax=uncultured Methylobacterium sp. TaxID=157278 RepID=UPI0035C99F41
MLRKAILALCVCFGIGFFAAPPAEAAPPGAAGITAAMPKPAVEPAYYYRRSYRRRYYRPRFYRRRSYYRPRYYRRHYYHRRFYRFF